MSDYFVLVGMPGARPEIWAPGLHDDGALVTAVADLIPMAPSGCAECGARVEALNAAIPGWAAATSTEASPVVVVGQWTGFSTASDTYDGVHPNASGDRKMAAGWYPALVEVLPEASQ